MYEIDPKIYSVWRFLQDTSSENILSLPDVENATKLETVNGFSQLSDPEKWLIGFCCNGGSAQPKKVSGRHNFNSWNRDKIRIANSLYKIREWSIVNDTYENIPNIQATWFCDPPYQGKGKWYKYHNIDYEKLARFVQGRNGQVIACDNTDANWLKFEPLVEVPFTHFKNSDDYQKTTFEGMWYKES